MKRGIAEHPKTKRLARRLAIPIPYAVGLVEMLCNQWAPRVAIQGDVGKWPDEDIADGLGFPGDPAELVTALVQAGWLDADPVHRLVIHDWHEHADQGVRNRLAACGRVYGDRKKASRALRSAVVQRDGMICRLCGEDVIASDLHLDHVRPRSKGGVTTLENLQVAHSWCNIAKADSTPDGGE